MFDALAITKKSVIARTGPTSNTTMSSAVFVAAARAAWHAHRARCSTRGTISCRARGRPAAEVRTEDDRDIGAIAVDLLEGDLADTERVAEVGRHPPCGRGRSTRSRSFCSRTGRRCPRCRSRLRRGRGSERPGRGAGSGAPSSNRTRGRTPGAGLTGKGTSSATTAATAAGWGWNSSVSLSPSPSASPTPGGAAATGKVSNWTTPAASRATKRPSPASVSPGTTAGIGEAATAASQPSQNAC